jgi:hypothetical protein
MILDLQFLIKIFSDIRSISILNTRLSLLKVENLHLEVDEVLNVVVTQFQRVLRHENVIHRIFWRELLLP